MTDSHSHSDDFSDYHQYWRNRDDGDAGLGGESTDSSGKNPEEDSLDDGRELTGPSASSGSRRELPGGARRRPIRRKAKSNDPAVAALHGLIGLGIDLAQKLEDGEHPWRDARDRGARAVREDREGRDGRHEARDNRGDRAPAPKDEISELLKRFDPSRFGAGGFGSSAFGGMTGGMTGGLVNDVLREASGAAESFLDGLRNREPDREDWRSDDNVVDEDDPDDDGRPDRESGD